MTDGSVHRQHDWYAADAPFKVAGLLELLAEAGWQPGTVLDVGCGNGDVLAGLCAALDARGTGLDPSPEAVALARRHPGLDIRAVSFGPGLTREAHTGLTDPPVTADLVLCVDVFEHIEDDVGFLERLTAHGDRFAFRIPLDDSVWDRLRGRTDAFRETYGHVHAYTRSRALDRLRRAGLVARHVRYHRIPAGGRVSRAVRGLTERVAPRIGARVIGGWSLLVLAERV